MGEAQGHLWGARTGCISVAGDEESEVYHNSVPGFSSRRSVSRGQNWFLRNSKKERFEKGRR